jgi:hypothetical protein
MNGICTLANDRVYDQLVALLNSIEVMLGSDFPVCVYPYDDNTTRIAAEIARRPNVQLYRDQNSIERWDEFARQIWDLHPTAKERWKKIGSTNYHRLGTHRRFCAFDGPFDRFLYMDADTLLMGPVTSIFSKLAQSDWVVYDFQHLDLSHVYDPSSKKLAQIFSEERLRSEIFCSGFYASKRDIFTQYQLDWLVSNLKNGEAEALYCMAPDQTVLNYMTMRSHLPIYNFALELTPEERTGCCVTSPHFEEQDYILYDHKNRLTYLHYIGLSSKLFAQVCASENVKFPYRDLFLYYRFLHEPEKQPRFKSISKPYNQRPNFVQQVFRKLKVAVGG